MGSMVGVGSMVRVDVYAVVWVGVFGVRLGGRGVQVGVGHTQFSKHVLNGGFLKLMQVGSEHHSVSYLQFEPGNISLQVDL